MQKLMSAVIKRVTEKKFTWSQHHCLFNFCLIIGEKLLYNVVLVSPVHCDLYFELWRCRGKDKF